LAIAAAAAFPVSGITADASDSDAASIKRGKTVYLSQCAGCHADSGKGDGVDLTNLRRQSDSELLSEITEGRNHAVLRYDAQRAPATGCCELSAHVWKVAV
jgi:mono/diheme cytochrome c family protein